MRYRDDVPLTESDFAAIRANVLRDVSRGWSGRVLGFWGAGVLGRAARRPSTQAPQHPVRAWAWAVAAIIAIIVSLRPVPVVAPASAPAGQRASRPPLRRDAAVPAAETAALRVAVARPRHHHPKPKLAKPHAIELLTANPDIRIIWITDRRNS